MMMIKNNMINYILYIEKFFIYSSYNSWILFLLYFIFQLIAFIFFNVFGTQDFLFQYFLLNNLDHSIDIVSFNTYNIMQFNFNKTNELNKIFLEMNSIISSNNNYEDYNQIDLTSSNIYDKTGKIPKTLFERIFPVLDFNSNNYLWKFKQDSKLLLTFNSDTWPQPIHNEFTPDKQLSIVLKELYSYSIQKEKFLNIIDNINNDTELFYPPSSITEFKEDIILIDSLLKELNSQANSLVYHKLKNSPMSMWHTYK